MPMTAFRRCTRKSDEIPTLWLYGYERKQTRLPVDVRVLPDGKLQIRSLDEDEFGVHETEDMKMVWLREMVDDATSEMRHSFMLFTPEHEYMLMAASTREKQEWVRHLILSISEWVLDLKSSTANEPRDTASLEELQERLRVREGEYIFCHKEDLKGGTYRGQWAEGGPSGRGHIAWSNGDIYDGQFLNGQFHGLGTRQWSGHVTNVAYNGEWVGGVMQGYGEMIFTNGSQYRGWWHQGSQHGYGELIQMDQKSHKNESYFGAWFQGQKEGYGIWDSEQTGCRYLGMWRKGTYNGPGVLINSNGKLVEGMFTGGKLQENDQEQASAVGIDPEVQWRHLVAGCIDKLEEQRQRRLTKKHSNGQTYSSTSSPGSAGRRTQKQARAAEDANGAVSPLSAPTSVDCDSSPSTPNRATSEWNALHILQDASHPLGMLVNKWSLCFIASYSGELGRHAELLPHARRDITAITKALQTTVDKYYPQLSEEMESDEELMLNRAADYFGTQDYVWLYRVVFPPILTTLMQLYRVAVKEKEDRFQEVRLKLRNTCEDLQEGLAEKLGFKEEFPHLQRSGALEKAISGLQGMSSCSTPMNMLLTVSDSYATVEQTCSQMSPLAHEEGSSSRPGGLLAAAYSYVLIHAEIKDLAAHLQFIQDFSGTELMFGDVGLAFKMCKDSFHSLLQMLK